VQLLGSVRRPVPVPAAAPSPERVAVNESAPAAAMAARDGKKLEKDPKWGAAASGAGAGFGRLGGAHAADGGLSAVAQRARQTKQKIRVEGYAKPDDGDRMSASLANANQVKDDLVKDGVPAEQIEVVLH